VLAQQAALNLAHLTVVQSGDSFQAHALDTSLFDTSERIRQVEMNLKSHEASHRSQRLRASGSLAG